MVSANVFCPCQAGLSCPCGVMRMRFRRAVMIPLKPVGELRGLIYRVSRSPGETPKNYVHFFKNGRLPILVTDWTGKRLYIAGGQFQVTARGIED